MLRFRHPHERKRQDHDVGVGRPLHGHGIGCFTELRNEFGQAVRASAITDEHRYLRGDQVVRQRLGERA